MYPGLEQSLSSFLLLYGHFPYPQHICGHFFFISSLLPHNGVGYLLRKKLSSSNINFPGLASKNSLQ